MKWNITVNDELAEKIDNLAKKNYMSRSGFIAFACQNYITQVEVVAKMKDLYNIMSKLSEQGMLDEEDTRNLKTLLGALPE